MSDALTRIERSVRQLQWMVGTNVALTLLVLGRMFLR